MTTNTGRSGPLLRPYSKELVVGLTLASGVLLSACNSSSGNGEEDVDQATFEVSTQAGAGGSISPQSQQASHGEVLDFEITIESGFSLVDIDGCNGSLSDTTYTTGAIEADCTITLTFDELAETPEPGVSLLVAANEEVELGSYGPALMNGLSQAFINAKGDVSLRSTMRDLDHNIVSGGASHLLVPADGSGPTLFLSQFLTIPQFPDGTPVRFARHSPAPDGSVMALVGFEEGSTEFAAAVRYHEGDYQVMIEPDDVPGLTDYSLRSDFDFGNIFRFNESGQTAIRLRVTDAADNNTVTWLFGEPENLAPAFTWGDGTGRYHPEYGEYFFRWPFLSVGNSSPAISADGSVTVYASTKTDRDAQPDDEFATIKALWSVASEQSDPEIRVRTRAPFINQKAGETEEFSDIAPGGQEQGYSLNDQGEVALLNGYTDDGFKRDLWFLDEDGYWPIARHGVVAPNTDQVGLSTGATFGRIGVPALSNSGQMTFQAEVEGQTSVWVASRDEAQPIAIAGMDAPGLDNWAFARLGLEALPPLDAPFINNKDQVIFWAELEDTSNGSSADSLWLHDACNGLWLIAMEDQEIALEGVPVVIDWEDGQAVRGKETAVRTLRRLYTPPFYANTGPTGPNTGQRYPLNDQGEFVFVGELDGDYSTGLISEGDTGTYHRQDVILKAQLPQCDA